MSARSEPLAARLRPQTLEEFAGQQHIIGPGRLLRRAIEADRLTSLIFYGPPGTGKTTLAEVIARTTQAHFQAINAVLAGVKDMRAAIAAARERHKRAGQRTLLFVDEVHRFNKSQQDALLPWVENGTVVLIGATTENPYFEVNNTLVSRSRLFQLKPLTQADLHRVLERALQDPERGYGDRAVRMADDALAHLVGTANGDARTLLNALELAVETTPPDRSGTIPIDLAVAEESIQQRAVLYDKEGDAHFDTVSALIKSVRGSDPDAALYWLARMLYAGEDPRFIFRRLLILASEDVGLADPQAVSTVSACAHAFDRLGLPEGRYPLAQATLYLATAAKSNSTLGLFDALAAVEQEQTAEVPAHLRDPNRDRHGFGHGQGYRYPHAYREHWVAQQYLPEALQGRTFYQPSAQGYEGAIRSTVERRREAQLAAWWEGSNGTAPPEVLTFAPARLGPAAWLQRTLTETPLAQIRDRLFEQAQLQRHHVVLDLNAGSGLLLWEAIRQVPEGGTFARARTEAEAHTLRQRAQALPELWRPRVLVSSLPELPAALQQHAAGVRFDCLIGRNALAREPDWAAAVRGLAQWLQPAGQLLLAERVPYRGQRLYRLLDPDTLGAALYDKLARAEDAIYAQDPLLSWDEATLRARLEAAGWQLELALERVPMTVAIDASVLARWFQPGQAQPSYGDRLAEQLQSSELEAVRAAFARTLEGQRADWESAIAWIRAIPGH